MTGFIKKLIKKSLTSSKLYDGVFLVSASMFANLCNLLYNVYLVRSDVISVEEFGIVGLIGSLLSIAQIPLSAYARTIVHETAYLYGKTQIIPVDLWKSLRRRSFLPSLYVTLLWILTIPFLGAFFQTNRLLPFILLTPMWLIGITAAIDSGFLGGVLAFRSIAIALVTETLIKLGLTILLVEINANQWFYISLPISSTISFFIGWIIAKHIAGNVKQIARTGINKLSKPFFVSSIMSKVSSIVFLNVDVLLAKHYLSPTEAGQYVFLSFVGKIVYFLGLLFAQFINPLISKKKGEGKSDRHIIVPIMIITIAINILSWIAFGIFGQTTLWFMDKDGLLASVAPYMSIYTLSMACLAIASSIISYYQAKEHHFFAVVGFFFSLLMIIGITMWHGTVADVANVMSVSALLYFVGILVAFRYRKFGTTILLNIRDVLEGLFKPQSIKKGTGSSILMLSWRDKQHIWSGGSEVYFHEIAKGLVASGYKVTMFCGNDQKSVRNQVIDGVQIVRRGGFYTVYLWAAVYYLFAFRGQFDLIIDNENGIPFFSPLYASVPSILVVHHVHQEVFQKHLWFPFSQIAMFLEKKIVPHIYRNSLVVTVSNSSKKEIIYHQIADAKRIRVIEPGIIINKQINSKKTVYPTILYFGRLKQYKRVDVALKAFAKVYKIHSHARLIIAGKGESLNSLKKLAKELNIQESVSFLGHVKDEEKPNLFASSWITIHPSSIEGWGITVIESNSYGTPVVGSNVNGLKDSIVDGKTGLLVPTGNIDEFAKAVLHLLDDKDKREKMSKAAKEWSQTFSWDDRINAFIDVIQTTYHLAIEKQKQLSLKLQRGWYE